jgi:hypothetical protein
LLYRKLLRNRGKQLLYVFRRFGAGLEKQQVCLSCVGLGVGGRYGALVGLLCHKIGFVSSESDDDVFIRLALELFDPCFSFIQ